MRSDRNITVGAKESTSTGAHTEAAHSRVRYATCFRRFANRFYLLFNLPSSAVIHWGSPAEAEGPWPQMMMDDEGE